MEDKQYKEIVDLSAYKMISQGNTAEIYQYNKDKILKLFREGIPKEAVESEYAKVKQIQRRLKDIPKVYEILKYKERYGIVYEYIQGVDMIRVMLSKAGRLKSYAKSLALLHFKMHKTSLNVCYNVKEKLSHDIYLTKDLSETQKKVIITYLNSLPEGDKLCHFDFHPGNVMLHGEHFTIIDWMTACTGDPNADVARTCLLLRYGELQQGDDVIKKAMLIIAKYIGSVYLKAYLKAADVSKEEVEQWILPVAAARLVEWISDHEKAKLLKLIY